MSIHPKKRSSPLFRGILVLESVKNIVLMTAAYGSIGMGGACLRLYLCNNRAKARSMMSRQRFSQFNCRAVTRICSRKAATDFNQRSIFLAFA